MHKILEIFKEITQIEHCSFKTQKLREYIISKSKEYGYSVKVDGAKNILAYKDNPKICLQAHYDMVCVGEAPNIEIVEKNGILKAKNSSLGADNGIAIAMMLYLMSRGEDIEALFTNDEEVGLIGAKNIELNIKSKYILNLDSEDEALVFIGCAGGVDIEVSKTLKEIKSSEKRVFKLELSNLPGGHSGVDIDKNIPNAILILNNIIKDSNALVSSFEGGVARNAIPSSATAVVFASEIKKYENLKVTEIRENNIKAYESSFVDDLSAFKNGVIDYNTQFNVVQDSSNIGIISLKDGVLKIDISMRSLSNENLDKLFNYAKEYWESRGYKVVLKDRYPAWKPDENEFAKLVKESLKNIFGDSKYVVIHAGLECGILKNIYPDKLFASIGPNIKYPHSVNEQVEIESVFKTYQAVEEILKSL